MYSNTQYLHSLLASVCVLNHAEDVKIHLLSPHVQDTRELYKQPHFTVSFDSSEAKSEILIDELYNLSRRRQMGEDYKIDVKTTNKLAERIPLPDSIATDLSFHLEVC